MDTDSKTQSMPDAQGRSGFARASLRGVSSPSIVPGANSWRLKAFVATAFLLVIAFLSPLVSLARFAANSELYSHILLIPFVSGYLVWLRRTHFSTGKGNPLLGLVLVLFAGALITLAWDGHPSGRTGAWQDSRSLLILSLVCLLYGAAIALLGWENFKRFQLPSLLLLFMVPFPSAMLGMIEKALQHGSALAAHLLFWVSQTPVLRQETVFQLPGISIQVAPQCSGIHSTLVLFITSIVASQWFLKRPLYRFILVAAVIPLALVRNGFRIFTIGELCVHYGRDMLNSYIHHNGGPIFFALSLIPLFMLLGLLAYLERKQRFGSAAA